MSPPTQLWRRARTCHVASAARRPSGSAAPAARPAYSRIRWSEQGTTNICPVTGHTHGSNAPASAHGAWRPSVASQVVSARPVRRPVPTETKITVPQASTYSVLSTYVRVRRTCKYGVPQVTVTCTQYRYSYRTQVIYRVLVRTYRYVRTSTEYSAVDKGEYRWRDTGRASR